MKKTFKITLVMLTIFTLNIVPVYASTNTKERTEDNYLVEDWVTVTEDNKNNILTTPAIDATEKVYDFADLFTDEEEQQLYTKITNYINEYNLDLAVVTIDENNKTPREYADDFYDYNDFNQQGGILFLIDMDNRKIYMSTTGQAIKMYNDYRINTALDEVYTYMSDEEYYEGTSNYIDKISDYAKKGVPTSNNEEKSLTSSIFMSLLIGLIGTAIIMAILIFKNKMVKKATTAREYLNKNSIKIQNMGEILISSNTTKHEIDHSSSGSSTHTGSSGSSHGGGGHSF